MTVSEMLQTMHENDLFDMFPEFSSVVHILAVIPATSCSAERSFSGLRKLKIYLRSTMEQQRVSNIALIDTGREYANSVVEKDMDRIIDIFGRRNGRGSYFFQRVLYVRLCCVSYDHCFVKNLGNLREFFGQMVHRPPPPQKKIARTPILLTKYLTVVRV